MPPTRRGRGRGRREALPIGRPPLTRLAPAVPSAAVNLRGESVQRSRPPFRWAAALLLLYQAFFLNVVVPGHTRGAITLDGKHAAARCPACCCCSPAADTDAGGTHAPSQSDRDNCAICNFAAHVTPAPAIDFVPPPLLELLATLPLLQQPAVISADLSPTYYGRGPPAGLARPFPSC